MNNSATPHLKTTYMYISAILFAPVLLWPIPIILSDNPMIAEVIIPKWHLSIIILLIASVAMDSIVYGARNINQSISHALWVAGISFLIIQNQQSSWILAALFSLHSFRSAYPVFKGHLNDIPWLTFVWSRDIISATVIFLYLSIFYL